MKNTVSLAVISLLILSSVFGSQVTRSSNNQSPRLPSRESEIIAGVNGSNVYRYDLELERLALNHSVSGYSFRSSGSSGATEAAQWIKREFESFGLQTSLEPFEFTTWDVISQPSLTIDADGNVSTTDDQISIKSFQPAHYSWPTPEGGLFRDLVILPLPEAANRDEVSLGLINETLWHSIDTTGKIVLIGREVYWNSYHLDAYIRKIERQRPAAIIYTWWHDWMSFTPPMFGSIGGILGGYRGPWFWDLNTTLGMVTYEDGLRIRNEEHSANVSAKLVVPAVIKPGYHYNVIARLNGSVNPEQTIIISGHYDTVMTAGFCDNGAGTSGVIELARVFAEAARQNLYHPESTLLFVSFAGEELGFVGAINYIKQHEGEMKNVKAVINLDCIGSDALEVTETFPDESGLDLDEIVLKAAEELDTKAQVIEPGGSDQEACRNPMMADYMYSMYWGLKSGMGNVTRVKASAMISSSPLFYSEKWEKGKGTPGWIHTSYDNSTSTSTLSWVETDDLETHVKVVALSIMKVSSYSSNSYLSQILVVTIAACVSVVALVFYKRSWASAAYRKTRDNILSYVGTKEIVMIVAMTAFLLFLSYVIYARVGRSEVTVDGFPNTVEAMYYGYPFEMVEFLYPAGSGGVSIPGPTEDSLPLGWLSSYRPDINILWGGLFLNLVFYLLLAFALLYAANRLMERHALRKSE